MTITNSILFKLERIVIASYGYFVFAQLILVFSVCHLLMLQEIPTTCNDRIKKSPKLHDVCKVTFSGIYV